MFMAPPPAYHLVLQQLPAGEDGQPVRFTFQREFSFLKGPDFTP